MAVASPKDDGQPAKKRAGVEARKRAGVEAGKRDPAKMASVMMQKFDKDSDQKLNVEELTAMMKFMQERRGQQGEGAGKGDAAGKEGGAGKKGRQRPGAEKRSDGKSVDDKEVGGVTPRRPPAE